MQIVIDIPEEEYQNYLKMRPSYPEGVFCYIKAIQNGTPLPKEYGTLKDTDKLIKKINSFKNNWDCSRNEYEAGRYESYDYVIDMIEDEPTIIKADKEE